MYKKITLLTLGAFSYFFVQATYVPVALTGFNSDVVANGLNLPSASTTGAYDDASPTTGFVFIADDYQNNGSCALPTSPYFLPNSGILSSGTNPGLSWQLASYNADNSMRLTSTTLTPGTVNFVTPIAAAEVYLLGSSGGGAAAVNVTVNFTDLTSQSFSLTIGDWYGGSPYVIQAGRVSRTSVNCTYDGSASLTGPRLYQYLLSLSPANYTKLIASVTITKTTTTGHVNLLAVSVNTPCTSPFDQPFALNLTPSTSQISGSFSPAFSTPDGYLVVRYPFGATPVNPTDATSYTSGSTLGTGTVVYSGANTSFTATGLFAATFYDFYVYAYNNVNCGGGPMYNTLFPLMGSQMTSGCGGPANVTIPIGPGQTYTNLTDAVNAISLSGVSGPVILELQSNYTSAGEPSFPITFPFNPCVSAGNNITIRPAASALNLVITSSNNGPTIDLNGGSNITIDGRPGGTNTTDLLQIINTSNSGAAIRFINDASFNTITYCDLQGQNSSITTTGLTGVVYFSTASTTNALGNDNNTISLCKIHGTSSATPAACIVSYGTNASPGAYNDNGMITNCSIYDFFQAGINSTGVKLDQGNSAWTVSNNSFYQTAARANSAAVTHRIMHINSNPNASAAITPQGSGFMIENNVIGGNGSTGLYTVSGTATTTTHIFMGMDISVGVGAPTVVRNNVIRDFSYSTANVSATAPNFVGFHLNYGNINIKQNTIGDPVNTGSITLTRAGTSTTAGLAAGIRVAGGLNHNIDSNIIAGITTVGSSSVPYSIVGIYTTGGSATINNITGNIIGSTTVANSIHASTTGGTQLVTGIWITGGPTTNIVQNTIANLNNNGTGTAAQVRGILVTTSAATVTGNNIFNLFNSSANTGSGTGASALGIGMTTSTAAYNVSGNSIYNLKTTSASANVNIVGLFSSGTAAGNAISRNLIYALSTTSTGTGIVITGMDIGGGPVNVVNNMVALGNDENGQSITSPVCFRGISKGTATACNFYHNSIYIGGSNVSTSSAINSFAFQRNNQGGADNILNNIFYNARSNSGAGGGKHYAITFGSNTNTGGNMSSVNLNYNIYYASGTGGITAFTTTDVPAYSAGWIPGDVNSYFSDPVFLNPSGATPNLHITPAAVTYAESGGTSIAGITTDFDNDIRYGNAGYIGSGTAPDIGADELNAVSPLAIKLASISAVNAGNRNRIDWNTETELSGDKFELERSRDGVNFISIYFVGATGYASAYTYWDEKPLEGINYYRLKLIDNGGRLSYSKVVDATVKAGNKFYLTAFPNPVDDHLTIVIDGVVGQNPMISILGIAGNLIKVLPVKDLMMLDMTEFSRGIYILKYTDSEKIQTIKINRR